MSRILLTGASGVIGRSVVEFLAGHHVTALVHADREPIDGVDRTLRADQSLPRLGLDAQTWAELARDTDIVIHSGALTDWGESPERYAAVNETGTRTLVDLARAAGASMHFVSTAFVSGIARGEVDTLSAENVVKPYICSKWACEQIVAESGLPYAIYRPTNLVGDSRSGWSHRPQIIQTMSEWMLRGRAPFMPSRDGNLIDVLPVDTAARAIAAGALAGVDGRTFWLTRGPESLTPRAALDLITEHAVRRGRPIAPIPLRDDRECPSEELMRVPASSRRFLEVLVHVSETTAAAGGALPTSMPELTAELGVPDPPEQPAWERSLAHWDGVKVAARTGESA